LLVFDDLDDQRIIPVERAVETVPLPTVAVAILMDARAAHGRSQCLNIRVIVG
jgi:hypothetical protein